MASVPENQTATPPEFFCGRETARNLDGEPAIASAASTMTFAEQRAFAAEIAKEEAAVEWAVEQVKGGRGWPTCGMRSALPCPQSRA